MSAQATTARLDPPPAPLTSWRPATRIAFRFCFVYFGLFILMTQMLTSLLPLPGVDIPDLSTLPPVRPVVLWTAAHVFHIAGPVSYADTGSGDRTFDWVLLFCELVTAVVATAVWSVLDRKRPQYSTLYRWFRLVLRLCLAGQMIVYGLAKVIPTQMPYPALTRLLEVYGNLSPMGVLWASIGASPAYEMFAGSAELLAGVLLIFPRTSMLGALVCLADMTQVFTLNMTYDVPVKLLSLHLWLMALFLLAPELKRLTDFFLLNRTATPSTQLPIFGTPRANRIAFIVQLLIGVWLIGMNTYGGWRGWKEYGGGAPKSPLYGIWDVQKMTIDGHERAPLLNDYGRLRRVVFDFPETMVVQRMDDSYLGYHGPLDPQKQTLSMISGHDQNLKAALTYQRPNANQLVLEGTLNGQKVSMQLQRFDLNKFVLVTRGFHWVQERPFNR
jgi:hypothetical protein